MPSASSCLLHVLCFAETPYQTESKRDKNGWRIFLEYLENSGRKIHARRCPRWPRGGGRAPDPRGPPVRRLMPFFGHNKTNFRRKIWAKVSIQSELRISIYIYIWNGERAAEQNAETERDWSNLGGALAPPTPWRPRTRGETLLHLGRRSRKKNTKGPPLPFSFGGAGTLPWPSSSPQSSPTTSPPSSPTLPPSMRRCNLSLTYRNLYLNMVLNAIFYFPMMYGYPMMFE